MKTSIIRITRCGSLDGSVEHFLERCLAKHPAFLYQRCVPLDLEFGDT
jgi:hypothetical protein